jgi:hypothetical protein
MKLKVVIVDLEIPPRVKKWALGAGIPVAVLLGGGAIAYASGLVTWKTGDTLQAADLNANFAYLQSEIAGDGGLQSQIPIITGWQNYAPTMETNAGVAISAASSSGQYRRVGDSAEVRIQTLFQSTPNTGATYYAWTLPPGLTIDLSLLPPLSNGFSTILGGGATSQGLNHNFALEVYQVNGSLISATANGASTYYMNDSVPIAWAAGSIIELYFTVPILGW